MGGATHLRARERVRRHLHPPRPAPPQPRRGRPLPLPAGGELGSLQQRLPRERRPPLPRRRQPPRVRHPRVRLDRRLVVHDKAGERILEGLVRSAEQRLREEGIRGEVYLFKNNTDSAGNSYGCHENYLVEREGDFTKFTDVLIPFLVTRQVYAGAGKVLQTARGAMYCVSQRAEHIWEGVSSATTRSRPIINTRDEPHADAERFRRLHVIVGDSNMSVGRHRANPTGGALHFAGISREPPRRPRDLDLWRARQGRHHPSRLPQHRAHARAPLRRAARPSARTSSARRPTPAAAATPTASTRRRAAPRSWWRRATPSPSGRASPTAGWAAARTTRPRSWPRSAPTPDFYEPYDENARRWYKKVQEEVTFVNHAIVNPPVDRDKPLDEVNDVYMHVEKETRRRPDRQRRQGGGDDLDADALQLHRQQRRAADQDQGLRLRLHRADRRARPEAVSAGRPTR